MWYGRNNRSEASCGNMSIFRTLVANSGTGDSTVSTTNSALHHLCANIQSRRRRYQDWMRAKKDPARIAGGGGKRAVSVGMIVCATSSDASIEITIGTAT